METIAELEATHKKLTTAYNAIASTPIMTYSISDRQIVYEQRKDLQNQISRLNRRIYARKGNSEWVTLHGINFNSIRTTDRVFIVDSHTWSYGTILLIAYVDTASNILAVYDLDNPTPVTLAKSNLGTKYKVQRLGDNTAPSGYNLANFNDEK